MDVICLTEKAHVWEKLSGMSYNAIGCEFNVNELTIYVNKMPLNRNTCKIRLYID